MIWLAGKDGCVPWLVNELGNLSTHWCTRAELAAVLGSLARIPALSAAMVSVSPAAPFKGRVKLCRNMSGYLIPWKETVMLSVQCMLLVRLQRVPVHAKLNTLLY